MKKFTLTIEFGNASMRTRRDLANALTKVAARIIVDGPEGKIRDVNGNTVGSWEITK
jgi:SMC interacting uncharacterized protein involved in chromosome segregation